MVTLKDMLQVHVDLKDQAAVWSAVVNWLGGFSALAGENKTLGYDGRTVPEEVIDSIREWVQEEKVVPLIKKIEDLEKSTVEVKDVEGTKQVGRKKRGGARREAGHGQ